MSNFLDIENLQYFEKEVGKTFSSKNKKYITKINK